MVNLTIDGKEVAAPKDATILEAAQKAGVHIPVLCHAKKLLPFGACRICLVEVEQMKGRLIPACTTPATEGMVVTTNSDEIRKVRKTVLEFLLVNHVVECPICDKGGECDLQDITYEYGVQTNRFEGEKFNLETDETNPFIERNMNRCILCGKCVRVCDEIVARGSYSFINRGFETKVATAFDRGLDCEFCGQCVSMCPVGALLPRPFKFKARPWQLSEVDTVCSYCGNGCTVTLGILKNKIETIRFNDKNGVNDGNLCIRGRFGYSYVSSEDRLKKPLMRKDGQLVEVEWAEALAAVSDNFKKAGKDTGVLATARLTNEEFQLLKDLTAVVGTENLDHSGGECYKGVTEGLKSTIGVAASTSTFPVVEEADAVLCIRSDFYETHPVFGMVVNQAVKRKDAKFFAISDKKGKFTKLPSAKTLLTVPGLEIDVLNAMSKVLLDAGLAKLDGVEGVAELKKQLAAYTPAKVEKKTGVSAALIEDAAKVFAAAERSAILLGYGVAYTANSKELATAAANFAILSGNVDSATSGLYLCGEKANSQGAIDLGVLPGKSGMGTQAMLDAAAEGKLPMLYIVGEDPVASFPDREKVISAIEKTPFVVVQDMFLSATAEMADVVLPAASFAEKDGTYTNAERRIQRVRKGINGPGECKADYEIFSLIVAGLGGKLAYTGPAAVFSKIAENVSQYTGIDFNAIGPQGVVWGGDRLATTVRTVVPVKSGKEVKGSFKLVTGSALYHSGTMSTRAQGPMAAVPEAYIELAFADATKMEISTGDMLTVKGNGVELKLKAKVGKRLPAGLVFAPLHFASSELNKMYKGEAAIPVEISK